jgi:prepilin peptidase CpaA
MGLRQMLQRACRRLQDFAPERKLIVIRVVFWGLLIAGAALVAYFDAKERRIPNLLVGAMLLCGFVLNGLVSGWSGVLHSVGGVLAGGGLLLVFYLRGGMEAGDVKYLAAIGSFVGAGGVLVVFIFASIVAGVMAAIELYTTSREAQAGKSGMGAVSVPRSPATIPYGVAISCATAMFLCLRVIL